MARRSASKPESFPNPLEDPAALRAGLLFGCKDEILGVGVLPIEPSGDSPLSARPRVSGGPLARRALSSSRAPTRNGSRLAGGTTKEGRPQVQRVPFDPILVGEGLIRRAADRHDSVREIGKGHELGRLAGRGRRFLLGLRQPAPDVP
jgi:hypothetical protein